MIADDADKYCTVNRRNKGIDRNSNSDDAKHLTYLHCKLFVAVVEFQVSSFVPPLCRGSSDCTAEQFPMVLSASLGCLCVALLAAGR